MCPRGREDLQKRSRTRLRRELVSASCDALTRSQKNSKSASCARMCARVRACTSVCAPVQACAPACVHSRACVRRAARSPSRLGRRRGRCRQSATGRAARAESRIAP
eukprot:3643087-Pleurochrysis_carterae.AAC.1